jgi:hypothetical protein
MAANLKWDQFHYGPVDPDFWATLGGIYLAAVEARLAQKPLLLYPGRNHDRGGVPQGAGFPRQRDGQPEAAADRDRRAPDRLFPAVFSLVREVRPENVYWVDAAKPLPPTRLAKKPEITPTLRFFSGTRAVEAVSKTIEQIRLRGACRRNQPGRAVRVDTVIPVLEHLALCWAPKPPMRSTAGAASIRR